MKIKIIGKKGDSLFDAWSFVHAGIFYILTSLLLIKIDIFQTILILIIIAFGWETIERYLEEHNSHFKKYFKEKECWANRYIGDPIANTIGFILAYLINN